MFLTSLLIDEDQDLTIIRKKFLDNQVVMVNAFVFMGVLFGPLFRGNLVFGILNNLLYYLNEKADGRRLIAGQGKTTFEG